MSTNNSQGHMLLSAGNERPQMIGRNGYLARCSSIIWAHLEIHRDRHFTMCAFHNTHQTMTGTILLRTGIILHSFIRPGAQCLYRQKIGEHHFTSNAGEASLQNITPAQIVLRSNKRAICRRNLEEATTLCIERATKDGWAVEVRETPPVYRSFR